MVDRYEFHDRRYYYIVMTKISQAVFAPE